MPPQESTPLLSTGHQGSQQTFNFISSTKHLLLSPWNILLVFIPIAFVAERLEWSAGVRFSTSFIAIVPLAKLLGDATEQLSMKTGQTIGGLLNATFGNAVELIVAIVALIQNELRLVQTSLLGSVLSNILLVLGMSFFASGFFFWESTFQTTAAQASSSLMTLACITLIIPAAYHASEGGGNSIPDGEPVTAGLLTLSRGTSVILLTTYIGYLYFQLRTHHRLFEAEEEEEEVPDMDAWSSGIWLLLVTIVTAFVADILVGSIEETSVQYGIPKNWLGIIALPLVGNAAEHVTSIWMACKGKMELTIGVGRFTSAFRPVAVGSSIQIAAGMIPLLVIIAWPMGRDLTLFFANFETIVMFVSVMLVNWRTNWLEGMMLISLYLVIALAFYV